MSDIEQTAAAAAAAINGNATKNIEKKDPAKKPRQESTGEAVYGTRVKNIAADQRWGKLKDLKGKLPKGHTRKPIEDKKPATAKPAGKPVQKPAAKSEPQPPKGAVAKVAKPAAPKPAPVKAEAKPASKPAPAKPAAPKQEEKKAEKPVPKGAVAKVKGK